MSRVNLIDNQLDVEPIYVGRSTVYINLKKELSQKEKDSLSEYINSTEEKLKNENFVNNAPPEVIEGTKKRLAEAKKKLV